MVELIKKFTKLTGEFFDFSKKKTAVRKREAEEVVYKTRTQLINEGKGAYIAKRYKHPAPVVNKLN